MNNSTPLANRYPCLLCILLPLVGLPIGGTTASFDISLASNDTINLTLNISPLAPFLRSSVEMEYTLQSSNDFQRWTTIETFRVTDPKSEQQRSYDVANDDSRMFFRAERTLSKDSLLLDAEDLSNSQFANLNLSGLDLPFTLIHEANFSQADLRGADMFATFGNRANFHRALLTGANLTASMIRDSEFPQANLAGATARFATMSGNNFRGADLRFVDFTGTDLFNTDMTNADLRGAILLETDLRFVRFHGAQLDALNRIPPTPLLAWQIVNEGRPGADLSGINLAGMILTESNLRGTNLRRANLTAVDLSGADLSGADLQSTVAPFINLRGAQLSDETRLPQQLQLVWEIVNLQQDDRQLDGVNLSETLLSRGHMQGFSLVGADLSSSLLIGTNLKHADLRNANLTVASLQGADLRFANLRGARMTRAQTTEAKFENTIMPDGTIHTSE